MSLNKFKDTQIGQDINLEAGFSKVVIKDEALIRGNVFPDNTTTAGFVLSNVDGSGTLGWTPDNGSGGDVSFTDPPPVQVGEVAIYSSIDGQGLGKSNVLLSDLQNEISVNTANTSVNTANIAVNTADIITQEGLNTGSVLVHSDMTAVGSGSIITEGERNNITTNTSQISTLDAQLNSFNVKIATGAGTGQGATSVAVGAFSGVNAETNSVSIGNQAGADNQKEGSIAIGGRCPAQRLGKNSIAIGGVVNDNEQNTISINASDFVMALNPAGGTYISPIRENPLAENLVLCYNSISKEITAVPASLFLNP